jgi:hypothetical protein
MASSRTRAGLRESFVRRKSVEKVPQQNDGQTNVISSADGWHVVEAKVPLPLEVWDTELTPVTDLINDAQIKMPITDNPMSTELCVLRSTGLGRYYLLRIKFDKIKDS